MLFGADIGAVLGLRVLVYMICDSFKRADTMTRILENGGGVRMPS
jgi:hypothetical protein